VLIVKTDNERRRYAIPLAFVPRPLKKDVEHKSASEQASRY